MNFAGDICPFFFPDVLQMRGQFPDLFERPLQSHFAFLADSYVTDESTIELLSLLMHSDNGQYDRKQGPVLFTGPRFQNAFSDIFTRSGLQIVDPMKAGNFVPAVHNRIKTGVYKLLFSPAKTIFSPGVKHSYFTCQIET